MAGFGRLNEGSFGWHRGRAVGQIDPDARRVFKRELQAENSEQGSAFRHVHQQIEAASLPVNAQRNRAERAHAARAASGGQGEQMIASKCKRFGRSHERSFAAICQREVIE